MTTNTQTKRCPRCEEFLPATNEYFGHCSATKDKLQGWCKGCMQARSKTYYQDNKEALKARNKTYYHQNKEAINANQKELRDSGYHKQKDVEYCLRDFGCVKGIYKVTLDDLIYIGKCDNSNMYKRRASHKTSLKKPVKGSPIEFLEKAQELKAKGLNPEDLFTFEVVKPGDHLTSTELAQEERQLIALYSRDFPAECVNRDHRSNK